jgi:hypothetical protein
MMDPLMDEPATAYWSRAIERTNQRRAYLTKRYRPDDEELGKKLKRLDELERYARFCLSEAENTGGEISRASLGDVPPVFHQRSNA